MYAIILSKLHRTYSNEIKTGWIMADKMTMCLKCLLIFYMLTIAGFKSACIHVHGTVCEISFPFGVTLSPSIGNFDLQHLNQLSSARSLLLTACAVFQIVKILWSQMLLQGVLGIISIFKKQRNSEERLYVSNHNLSFLSFFTYFSP